MWYLAEILFAQPKRSGRAVYACESCNVIFQATAAGEAYGKALAWGQAYVGTPPTAMALLGVSHLTTIGEELGDGVEICGRFFEETDVWERIDELIPPPGRLKAAQWEQGRDRPLGELLNPEQVAQLKRVWGKDAE